MNKSILVAFFLIFSSSLSFAQKNINNYKYIIVPKQYEFQKNEDSYQINSLIKFLFERDDFITFFSTDTFPVELANNSCMALKAMIKNKSGMLNTKLNIDLVDCYNNVVFSTSEAKSKEKDYKKAYQETIRMAFEDIEALNYTYSPENISQNKNNQIEVKKPEDTQKVVVKEIEPKVNNTKIAKEVKMEKIAAIAKPIEKKIAETESRGKVIADKLPTAISIEGIYLFDTWGKSSISKKDNEYSVTGGDENVAFATIYKTSKPTIYIIKWRAFKQPQLVEIDSKGNLNLDSETGKKVCKRVE